MLWIPVPKIQINLWMHRYGYTYTHKMQYKSTDQIHYHLVKQHSVLMETDTAGACIYARCSDDTPRETTDATTLM